MPSARIQPVQECDCCMEEECVSTCDGGACEYKMCLKCRTQLTYSDLDETLCPACRRHTNYNVLAVKTKTAWWYGCCAFALFYMGGVGAIGYFTNTEAPVAVQYGCIALLATLGMFTGSVGVLECAQRRWR